MQNARKFPLPLIIRWCCFNGGGKIHCYPYCFLRKLCKDQELHCHLNGSTKLKVSDGDGCCQFVQFCAASEKKGKAFQVGLPQSFKFILRCVAHAAHSVEYKPWCSYFDT